MENTSEAMELKAEPKRGVSAQFVTITVTVTNKSNKDVSQGNVGLQDSDTGDSGGAYFGYIRGGGGSDTRTVSLRGGVEIVLAHFEASDGSSWTGSGAFQNATHIKMNLN